MNSKNIILLGLCIIGLCAWEAQAVNLNHSSIINVEDNLPTDFETFELHGDLLLGVGPNAISAGYSRNAVCVHFNQSFGNVSVALHNEDGVLVYSYMDEGDFSSAMALAGMLPSLYGLAGNDLAEHENYMNLLELYRDLYNTGRNTMQLDSVETASVEEIAYFGTGYPKTMAQAIINSINKDSFATGSFDCPLITIPESGNGRGGHMISKEDISRAMGMSVIAKPNPANAWVAIDYTLPAGATKATLTLTNTLGVAVMTAELNGAQGQKVLDLRPLAAGVYGYAVRCGEYVQNGKIVVTK